MAARGSRRIINIASQQAFRAFGNSGVYGVSRGGLVSLTRSQAEAWSPRGVRCNAVAPGLVFTPMTSSPGGVFDPDAVRKEGRESEAAKAQARRAMVGRNGVPEDLKEWRYG